MAPKFDLATADVPALRHRVTELTTGIVKQKKQIEALRATEHQLAGDKEKLQRQIRNLQEEAAMSREMRADLQGEVARLQRALEHQTAEADMLRSEVAAQREPGAQNAGAAAPDETTAQLRKAAEDAEARAAVLSSEVARHRNEANALSEELEELKDTYEMERRRWAAAARAGDGIRALPLGPSPVHAPAKTASGDDEEGPGSSREEHQVERDHAGHEDDAAPSRPPVGGADADEAGATRADAASALSVGADVDSAQNGWAEGAERDGQLAEGSGNEQGARNGTAGSQQSHAGELAHGGGVQTGAAMAVAGGWAEQEIDRMKQKVAEQRKRCRELEATVSSLQHELAQAAARRHKEEETQQAETREASERYAALGASLSTCQKAHQQAQLYIKELETQRDERERDITKLREAIKAHETQGGQAAASSEHELAVLKDKLAQLQDQHEHARAEAAKAMARAERASEAAAAAEAEMNRRAGLHAAQVAQAQAAVKRADEREAAAKREADACKRLAEDAKAQGLALREEVCVRVCVRACVCIHTCTCILARTHIGTHMYARACAREHTHKRTHARTHTHTCTCTCTCTQTGAAADEHGQEHR